MANSKYEYVRAFERDEILLPNTWIVVRIDGRGFHRLSTFYKFTKPNDGRALHLMNAAALAVLKSIPDVCLAYGVSDEFSFVFERGTNLFERRAAKLVSTVVSTFTAFYVLLWSDYFGDDAQEDRRGQPLDWRCMPTFDGRAICYPSNQNLRDYLSWRQVDCHINNLYNTTFWTMVQKGGMSTTAAEEALKRTMAADKNEILYSRFAINYNNEDIIYRKGSVIFREYAHEESQSTTPAPTVHDEEGAVKLEKEKEHAIGSDETEDVTTLSSIPLSKTQAEKLRKGRSKARIAVEHLDIIKDDFWTRRPWILSGRPGRPIVEPESAILDGLQV